MTEAPQEVTPILNGHSSASSISTLSENVNVIEGEIEVVELAGSPRSSRENTRKTGTVKWFNAKNGYGFVTRHDTGDDIFVHFSGISRKNPRHTMKSLGDGELVEFNLTAVNVTGPGGRPVRGNPYVSNFPIRRNDSFASGDPATFQPNRRYVSTMDTGNSRIPRYIPNWQQRF